MMSCELEPESHPDLESGDADLESVDSELSSSSIGEDYTLRYGPLRQVTSTSKSKTYTRLFFEAEFDASTPGQMVSIKARDGAPYIIPLDVLLEDSRYFTRALFRWPPRKGQFSIDIDISSKDFGLYVSVMYPAALCQTELTLQQVWPIIDREEGPHVHHPWPMILLLWELGDRFLNGKVTSIAEAELNSKLCDYSATAWQSMYEHRSEATLKKRMLRLQNAFRLCQDKRLPFGPSFAKAASQAPRQVLAACADDLDNEVFKSEVRGAFASRFADRVSTAKKRRRGELREGDQQEKKQKIEN